MKFGEDLCEGGRAVWGSLVQDMAVTRRAEPASETDKYQLECTVVPSVQVSCHVTSQCPPTVGRTKSAGLDLFALTNGMLADWMQEA